MAEMLSGVAHVINMEQISVGYTCIIKIISSATGCSYSIWIRKVTILWRNKTLRLMHSYRNWKLLKTLTPRNKLTTPPKETPLKDGRVLIEASSKEEINALSAKINEKCGKQLDVHVPKLWKPRLIEYNVPDDILVDNIENTIISQNPELDLNQGDITARFKIKTRKEQNHMVIDVGPETRKKLLHCKLKIGWLICKIEDYLVAKRCFRCSRFNHRHSECRGEETCPLCAGNHKLQDCTTPQDGHKCINCIIYHKYTKTEKVCVNHSSLNKNCSSLQAVLNKYRQNTDYYNGTYSITKQ
ncbi:hypothetical protein C0J52_00501 [Blattella germanica]|nr:hypothetical protein C0J52_00501 [Blattella germanica]